MYLLLKYFESIQLMPIPGDSEDWLLIDYWWLLLIDVLIKLLTCVHDKYYAYKFK